MSLAQELLGANETTKEAQSQQEADLQRLAQEKEALESKVEILEHQAKAAAEGVDQVRISPTLPSILTPRNLIPAVTEKQRHRYSP